MTPPMSRQLAAAAVYSSLMVISFGCTRHGQEPGATVPAASPRAPASSPTKAAAASIPAATPSPGASKAPASSAPAPSTQDSSASAVGERKGTVPPALLALQKKLQPGGTSPTEASPATPAAGEAKPQAKPAEQLNDKALAAGAEDAVKSFVEALGKGDMEAARKSVFTQEDFQKFVQPGFRAIVESPMIAENEERLTKLVEQLKGKSLTHSWQPQGMVAASQSKIFMGGVPAIANGVLEVKADGVALRIRVDQLVKAGSAWKIFRFNLP